MGDRQWYIVGYYLASYDNSTIKDVIAAIGKRPRGAVLLVAGNFDTNLAAPEGQERDKRIEAAHAEEGLEDMSGNFLPRHKPWMKDGRKWAMQWDGREVHFWNNYILGTESRLFQNVAVQDSMHNTDHYLVLRCLREAAPAAHSRYLGKRTHFSIRPQVTPDKADHMF